MNNINENSVVCNGNTAQTSSSSISLTVGECYINFI